MRIKTISIAFLILALAVILAACGDTATPQTITLPPTTAGASNGGGANAGAGSNSGGNTGTGSNNGGAAGQGQAGAPAPTVDPNAKVEIPTIADTTEIQVSAASLANGGPFGRFMGGASSGISPTVKVYASNDDVATLTNNVTTTLQSAGFTRAGFGGGAGGFRGGANGTPGAGFNGTPRAGGFNGTPRAGANGTPGAGGQRGGFGGGGLWSKQGDADIFFTVMQVPASGQQSTNPFFSNLDQATQQQLQGKNSVLVIIAAPGLAQSFRGGFGGGNGGQGGNGQGVNGGNAQNTPSNT